MSALPPITLKGVKQNNLKNIDVEIPQRKLTVVTGLSGSGKSTLAFETLYAEGQRRYVESLSTYTRQFLEKMPKPDLESIVNIPPAIALEQRNTIQNTRSTVATQTEMLDYLRLFYSKVGTLICKVCSSLVIDVTPDQLRKVILEKGLKRKFALLSPLAFSTDSKTKSKTFLESYFQILADQGFRRVFWSKQKIWAELSEAPPKGLTSEALYAGELFLLMDRFNFSGFEKVSEIDKDTNTRYNDSLEQALKYGHEQVLFLDLDTLDFKPYQTGFVCLECGTSYPKPSPNLFSFNSPIGACTRCNGFGHTLDLDEKKVIPNANKPLDDGCIDPLDKPSTRNEYREFIRNCTKKGIRPSQSYAQLSAVQKKYVWSQVEEHFKDLEGQRYKFHVRIFIRRYQSPSLCSLCHGSRLKPEALQIKVRDTNVAEMLALPISGVREWFKNFNPTAKEKEFLKDLYPQIVKRLDFLVRVGVPYLTLNRQTRSLSGGEFQRINLATHLGNGLVGTLYVLDEPTIGLHPFDTDRLLDILRELRDQGNTLVVVEHETKILKDADWIIELGPEAGRKGGSLVAQGTPAQIAKSNARTAQFLKPRGMEIKRFHPLRKNKTPVLSLIGCSEHNLQNIDVEFPLNKLIVVTGVSGSGKTTLVHGTLAQALNARLHQDSDLNEEEQDEGEHLDSIGAHKKMTGYESIQKLVLLDQKPIGKNSRSNPATYMKAWDEIRKLMANQPLAVSRGYGPGFFSFNVDGGRCPTCKGEGEISIDMHFMAEVKLPCEDCEGKRFIKALLDVKHKGKSVSDLLRMTIDDAHDHFFDYPLLKRKFQVLKEVGLGYLELGQSGPTLSGGEAQRLKIAASLDQEAGSATHDMFILDEPSTGLHQDDVAKLVEVLQHLVSRGKSVVLIEHNLDIIANADYVIDLGPEGGAKGGSLIAAGTPEELVKIKDSKTGAALKEANF